LCEHDKKIQKNGRVFMDRIISKKMGTGRELAGIKNGKNGTGQAEGA
jgi:hypothetical protein